MKDKFKKILLKDNFIYYALLVGLIAIIIMIAFGAVVSIVQGKPWEKVEACVENSFLAFCLFAIVIGLKRGNERVLGKLFGELLAIYLLTNTTYFVEMLIEVIEGENIVLDYIYLAMEFLIMLTSVFVFLDHLFKTTDKREKIGKLAINIMLIMVFVMIFFDLIAIFIYDDLNYTLKLIDEFIYVIFGTSLAFAVLSNEMKRLEKLEKQTE